jgi:hypothetical protein
VSCAPTQHTPEPYRSDPAAARALEARAEALCAARPAVVRTHPVRPFITDGCSAWPDGPSYLECCVEHDLLYWCGGTAAEREAADDRFGRCVAERSSSFLGAWMRLGVRIGGHPIFPTPYRWGYGLEYSGGHATPDPDEEAAEGTR